MSGENSEMDKVVKEYGRVGRSIIDIITQEQQKQKTGQQQPKTEQPKPKPQEGRKPEQEAGRSTPRNPYAVMNGLALQRRYSIGLQHGSMGAWTVTSKWEIEHQNGVLVADIGNGKGYVRSLMLRKDFYDAWISERTHSYTIMLGAICGDVAGSVYEHHNIKYVPDKDHLISHYAHFTDDSVLTLAVAEGIMHAMQSSGVHENFSEKDEPLFLREIAASVRKWGRRYPNAGYGSSFYRWLSTPDAEPYNSWGNGSAMRASYAGYAAKSLKDAEWLARVSASITHNHPKGIEGAAAVAGSIFLLKQDGTTKEDVLKYVSQYYDMNFTLDEIRDSYRFDVSCQGSVPQAIEAFLEGNSFEEVLALAISIGGDSDTIAAIAGSLAERCYPIPEGIRGRVLKRLDWEFKTALADTIDYFCDKLL